MRLTRQGAPIRPLKPEETWPRSRGDAWMCGDMLVVRNTNRVQLKNVWMYMAYRNRTDWIGNVYWDWAKSLSRMRWLIAQDAVWTCLNNYPDFEKYRPFTRRWAQHKDWGALSVLCDVIDDEHDATPLRKLLPRSVPGSL